LGEVVVEADESNHEVSVILIVTLGRAIEYLNLVSVHRARLDDNISDIAPPCNSLVNGLSSIPCCSCLIESALDSEETGQRSIRELCVNWQRDCDG
jgi:hypothetical protein